MFSDGVITMRGQVESSRGSSAAAHGSEGTGLLRMPGSNTFIIESDLSSHRLLFNGQEIGTFATLEAAEQEATEFANRAVQANNSDVVVAGVELTPQRMASAGRLANFRIQPTCV
jgi:hypothetical protein